MIALLYLLLAPPADPCRQDTSGWKSIRHGSEEIRYLREEGNVRLAARNRGKSPVQVDIVWSELEISGTVRVFDVTSNKDEGKVRSGFAVKLAPGACAAYLLRLE